MDLIDIRQLRAFQLLARSCSFTAAAKEMFVTQSAISHSIKALETSLDQKLFDRSGKTVALTAEGESLLVHADRIMNEMQLATEELKAMSQWGYGRLRVGGTDTMCQHLLPPVLQEFRASFPHVDVSIKSADTGELLSMLAQGEIDLAVGIIPTGDAPACEVCLLFADELVFAVPPTHSWVGRETLTEEALGKECFLIYGQRGPTYQCVVQYFRTQGLHAPKKMELGNMEAIRELAKSGLGVGVIARWVIDQDLRDGALVAVTPPGDSPIRREWGAFLRSGGGQRPLATDVFLGICKTVGGNLELAGFGGVERMKKPSPSVSQRRA